MFNLYGEIKKRLNVKILIALTVSVAMVMALVIALGVANQKRQLRKQMTVFGGELKSVAYAAIKYPMSIGDSASVERQLIEIRDLLHDTEIIVCDFNKQVIFATHPKRIGSSIEQVTENQEILTALEHIIATGEKPSLDFFEEEVQQGQPYLFTLHGLTNEPECHHCHGSSRKVLGCLITRQSTGQTYAAIATLRNMTIVISVLGIAAVVFMVYFLFTHLVTKPVKDLAGKAVLLAHGDLNVAVTVTSDDSIGVLGRSFNSMVKSIKDQIEYSNSLRDAIAAPLFIVNPDKVITYMNDACEKLVGYSKEEVVGKRTCSEVFLSDRCESNCPLRYCLEDGEVVDGITAIITDRQGKKIPIMTSASALKDGHGEIIGAVEICKDITDLLEAERLRFIKVTADREEEQRRYLEGRVKVLLDVLSQVSDGNLNVRATLLGRNDIMDKIASHLNLTFDELEKLYAKISTFNKELEGEVDKRTLMLRDKTVLLERANRELRELDKLKSAFLANMSHELRTPMNSIIGYTDLLLDRIDGEINEEQEKSLSKVERNAQHLLQLINDILDMAKIESGKIELAPEMVDIRELTESISTIFEPTIGKKGISFTLDFADDLPDVYVDEDKVRQIFINLFSNAIKFTEEGGISIHVRPLPPENKADSLSYVEVCVVDSGVGIKQEDIGKLFDKFSQIDVSSIRQYEGTGLGLSIARGLVVLHKGRIWAESEFGVGSRFYFTLPADKSLLEKPDHAEIDSSLAEKLAATSDTPKEVFLQQAIYGGKPIKCWEFSHCGQISCPAYNNKEFRCWLIPGTHCQGKEIVNGEEKISVCRWCEIVERLRLCEAELDVVKRATDEDLAGVKEDAKSVLVIDDNPEVIDLVQKYIGEEYQVVGLLSGHEAVAKAVKLKPVAITLDIMMPEKDGWEVLYELKQNSLTQDIPVIILSIVDNKKLGFSLGAAEYIVKPINRDLLLHKLQSLEKITRIQKILVVDTDPRTIALMDDMLAEGDYQTVGAQSSEEALGIMQNMRPDLIVLNPLMEQSGGIDIIEYLKADQSTKDIPLILLTQKELSDEELNSFNGRIQAILNKGSLTKEKMLEELAETIKKCQGTK